MTGLRRTMLLAVLACSACEDEDPFTVQFQGEFLAYATADEVAVCEGNVIYAERWMIAVADQLGISAVEILPTTYYLVDPSEVDRHCGPVGACTKRGDDHIEVYASEILHRHELVHAIQFSAWPPQRALLREGLAVVYSDHTQVQLHWNSISSEDLDALIEIQGHKDLPDDIYFVGPYLVYWTIARHGAAEFESFWRADAASDSRSTADFRATFEQHFGESLDAMIEDVQKFGPACVIPTCVDDLVEWQGDRWTFDSPQACGGTVRGEMGEDPDSVWLEHTVLVEIPTSGPYVISVSPNSPGPQGIVIAPCTVWCGSDDWIPVSAGAVDEVDLIAGRYRVHAFKRGAEDPGVTVEIQPAG